MGFTPLQVGLAGICCALACTCLQGSPARLSEAVLAMRHRHPACKPWHGQVSPNCLSSALPSRPLPLPPTAAATLHEHAVSPCLPLHLLARGWHQLERHLCTLGCHRVAGAHWTELRGLLGQRHVHAGAVAGGQWCMGAARGSDASKEGLVEETVASTSLGHEPQLAGDKMRAPAPCVETLLPCHRTSPAPAVRVEAWSTHCR